MAIFASARLKIERAYEHIEEFEALAGWYCVPSLHSAVSEYDPATGSSKIILKSEPLPPHAPLIFGDVIHCLRAALDHAAYDLTHGKTDKNFISFPFGETRESLKATMKGGKIRVAGEAATNAILNDIRPYRIDEATNEPGNVALWMLNKIDNIDKHRTLLLATSQLTMSASRIRMHPRSNINIQNVTLISEGGGSNDMMQIGGEIMQIDGSTSVQIIISEPDFFKGEPVIPTLRQLSQFTTQTVEILERHA